MNRHSIFSLISLPLLAACILCSACHHDKETDIGPSDSCTAYTIAVVMPMDESNAAIWERTASMFFSNLDDAQQNMTRRISLDIEWYDENVLDLDSLAKALRMRPEVMCVIGPQWSADVNTMAYRLGTTFKTMISPSATSAEVMRSYADKGFFWSLVESDVTQCEMALSRAISYGYTKVSLIASKSLYGQTFTDWFAYQATEMGLEIGNVYTYDDDPSQSALRGLAGQAMHEDGMLLCAPSDMQGVRVLLEAQKEAGDDAPFVMFTDISFTPEMLQMGGLSEFSEGLTPYSNPESGFEIAYRIRFAESPSTNESQFYDALTLAALALTDLDNGLARDMNEAMRHIVNGSSDIESSQLYENVWQSEGMHHILSQIRSGIYSPMMGASGLLVFDSNFHSTMIRSVYAHWMVYRGHFLMLNFLTTDGSHRTESSWASWEWQTSVIEDFKNTRTFDYPKATDNWALLVAASEGWENYRHQADVLNMYQILKKYGYRDDHIVLIMEDDLVDDPRNSNPGKLLRYDNENLYYDVVLDYHLHDIEADDISRILTGQRSEHLPTVIDADSTSNVLVFWSGHGEQGSLLIGERDSSQGLTTERMKSLLAKASQAKTYRKMLWLIETCYAASVGVAAQEMEVPGVMIITASSAMEPSKADVKTDGIWRTNKFSRVLTELISDNPGISYRNLYQNLAKNTLGSHVTLLNVYQFDNLYKTNILEFLQPVTPHQNE